MSSPTRPALFLPAAQPDIVRAAQKDFLYLDIVTEAVQDSARALLGPRQSLAHTRETQLLSALLYHALTTGAGAQTLGEEYCDLLQVSGNVPVEPSTARRVVLVLGQTVIPYCIEWLSQAYPATTINDEPTSRESHQDCAETHGRMTSVPNAPLPHERLIEYVKLKGTAFWSLVRCNKDEVARLHLALFYYYGIYYQWSKRMAGIKYAFMGKAVEARTSYRVLGILLMAQLAFTAGVGISKACTQNPEAAGRTQSPKASNLSKDGHAPLLQGNEDAGTAAVFSSSTEVADMPNVSSQPRSSRKCALCLSVRTATTSIPCGHLFCWHCIAEWSNQRAECPLCRANFTAPQLVRVFHTDL